MQLYPSRPYRPPFLPCGPATLLVLTSLGTSPPLAAQDTEQAELRYITAISSPNSFEINRTRVVISDQTSFGLIAAKEVISGGPLPRAVQRGAYVQVFGPEQC
jgi:hypothetical protein